MIRTQHSLGVATTQQSLTASVVEAVADATERDAMDLEPLHHVVDPDALNRLFETAGGDRDPASVQLTFTYAGCEVVVDGTGHVDVTCL